MQEGSNGGENEGEDGDLEDEGSGDLVGPGAKTGGVNKGTAKHARGDSTKNLILSPKEEITGECRGIGEVVLGGGAGLRRVLGAPGSAPGGLLLVIS